MSAHTTGPWAVCAEPPNEHWQEGLTISAADPADARRVCDVYSIVRPPHTGSMAAANARLIAAAPDLLAALKALAAMDDGDEPAFWPYSRLFDAAVDAIAKATGEQA